MMAVDEGKLRAYLDGELSPVEGETLESQLADSPELQLRLGEMRQEMAQVRRAFDRLAPTPLTVSPARSALARLQAALNPDGSGAFAAAKAADQTSWESPTLGTELKNLFNRPRHKRGQETNVSKKFILATLSSLILIGLVVVVALWPMILGEKQPDLMAEPEQTPAGVLNPQPTGEIETTSVLVALQPISQGTPLTPGSIGRRDWPTNNLPADFVATGTAVMGRIAQTDIVQGQIIVREMLLDPLASDTFELPEATRVSATFDDKIELIGYRLEKAGQMSLTLYWRARQPIENDYTVFIHARRKGETLGQWDSPPVQGLAPTSAWQPGEIIVDTYDLLAITENFPPGAYDLVLGLYDANTGQRLPVQGEGLAARYAAESSVLLTQIQTDQAQLSFSRGIQVDPRGDTEANIRHLKTLGMGWVKFQMAWKEVEPSQGKYFWDTWDQVIDAYAANDIKVLLSIPKAPDWARPTDDDKSIEGPPTDPAAYAEFVGKVADRYAGKVQAIEIWNEQNLWYEAGGRGRIDAAQYVELLQQAYLTIKAVNQEITVVSGALTPAGNVDDLAVDDIEYLEQMYAAGAKGYFDALGAHPSGYNCPALADWQTVTPEEAGADPESALFTDRHHSWCFLGTMAGYREVMTANNDGGTPIWATEFGWAVADQVWQGYQFAKDNSPEEQAQWTVETYHWAEEQGWVGPMFLWNLDYALTAPGTELGLFSIIGQPVYYDLAGLNTTKNEPPTSAPTTFNHGILVDAQGDTQTNIEHLRRLGLGWVELEMPWQEVEPEQGQYEWEKWDDLIDAYAANDLRILLKIAKAPDWARPADDDKSVDGLPEDPTTYAEFVAQVASRYARRVQAIEVWHWQNFWGEVGGRGRMDPAEYVELLKQAYRAIKIANEQMVVVSGAMTPAGNVGDLATDDIDYLEQMYALGANNYFDVLGANPSGYNCPALADWRAVTAEEAEADPRHGTFSNRHHSWCFLGTMEGYRDIMLANGDQYKSIWPIEFGWAVTNSPDPGREFARDNTPEEQARWIVEAYQWGSQQDWVGPMFLANLDFRVYSDWRAPFSIVGQPAYDALIEMNSNNDE